MKKRLLWQIYPTFMIITVLGLFAISWSIQSLIRISYENEKKAFLERMAYLSLSSITPVVGNGDLTQIQRLCEQMGSASGVRYTVMDVRGKVLGDSREGPQTMVSHFDRPEFQAALKGRVGSHVRSSETLKHPMMYVAVPIQEDGKVMAVLRTSVDMAELQITLNSINGKIFYYGLITVLIMAALSLGFGWKITRPLDQLRRGAERFAKGDLNHRLSVSPSREIGALAESMNSMAGQLDERLRTIIAQKNEQQAVLSSMIEGVVALNTDGHIISLNKAAARMLKTSPDEAIGRIVEEIIRNTELQQFVRQTLDSREPLEDQITLHETGQQEQYWQAHGTAILDEKGNRIGALIVLNDVTHIRQLEQVRRDFVANVSHELKTPVTSIKGFIETLMDGAINNPQDAHRFLEIISRQTNRLNSIIDDLLTLSRIEQQNEHTEVEMEAVLLKPILTAAAGLCEIKAAEKNISIQIECDETLKAALNASLIEQAIVNLVDNAIKYSNPGGKVRIETVLKEKESEVLVKVHDNGCGIAKEHLPRLFERFYRVDKARSRTLGGTGLGLAIVKHIVHLHHGTVTVDSTVEKGSTFTLHLPRT
jgi:two-component system phosphate regulon sensor histidine kinase PhoR